MDTVRRRIVASLGAALAASAAPALRAQATHSTLRAPLPVEIPDKIEIAEFFWYGCIHCYNLEPLLEEWVLKLPADVRFRRIPAVFNARWGYDAGIYYAFETLGVLERVHRPFFDAIHKDRLKSDNPDSLAEFLGKHKIDPRKFDATLKSFGVQSKVQRAAQVTGAAQIDGTPALMVHGRYTISTEQGRSREGMLANADKLIPVVRKSLSAAK
jgi:thiol:disulfide interchange protein DsbA